MTMVSSLVWASGISCFKSKPPSTPGIQTLNSEKLEQERIGLRKTTTKLVREDAVAYASMRKFELVSLATSAAFLLYSTPANAGFLSGFSGIESIPGPELPKVDFLSRWNEENQKKYAEADARFKESPLLKKLLEQSKLNKEKNRQSTFDKYCLRGAELGVGDCSAEGMSIQDRENFISMLKKKAGVE